jgi:hypothetical protein
MGMTLTRNALTFTRNVLALALGWPCLKSFTLRRVILAQSHLPCPKSFTLRGDTPSPSRLPCPKSFALRRDTPVQRHLHIFGSRYLIIQWDIGGLSIPLCNWLDYPYRLAKNQTNQKPKHNWAIIRSGVKILVR